MGRNFVNKMFKPVRSAGNWTKHAAEDTFHWTEHKVGSAGKTALKFAKHQTEAVTGIFKNPMFLVVVGCVVVAVIIIKS